MGRTVLLGSALSWVLDGYGTFTWKQFENSGCECSSFENTGQWVNSSTNEAYTLIEEVYVKEMFTVQHPSLQQ